MDPTQVQNLPLAPNFPEQDYTAAIVDALAGMDLASAAIASGGAGEYFVANIRRRGNEAYFYVEGYDAYDRLFFLGRIDTPNPVSKDDTGALAVLPDPDDADHARLIVWLTAHEPVNDPNRSQDTCRAVIPGVAAPLTAPAPPPGTPPPPAPTPPAATLTLADVVAAARDPTSDLHAVLLEIAESVAGTAGPTPPPGRKGEPPKGGK